MNGVLDKPPRACNRAKRESPESVPSEFRADRRYFVREGGAAPGPGAARPSSATTARSSPRRAASRSRSTDMLAEGTHFLRGTDPRRLGHKSLAVNLSDLAAMGADLAGFALRSRCPRPTRPGSPRSPGHVPADLATGSRLVGGDIRPGVRARSRSPRSARCRPAQAPPTEQSGRGPLAVRRDRRSRARPRAPSRPGRLTRRHRRAVRAAGSSPSRASTSAEAPRVASAAIDVSDGLLADIGHVAGQSQVAAGSTMRR